MTARVIPFPPDRASRVNRQPRECRSWCIDHSADPEEPEWPGECTRVTRGPVEFVATQPVRGALSGEPEILVEPAGVHLTLAEAVELHGQLGELLTAVCPSGPSDPPSLPDTRRGA